MVRQSSALRCLREAHMDHEWKAQLALVRTDYSVSWLCRTRPESIALWYAISIIM